MNPILKNIIAFIAGALIGGAVNMGIIMLSGFIIPPPEGADVTTTEGLKASIHLFQPKHFIMPFLAHALGTLVGAWIAAMIAATHQMKFALAIGVFFLIGGTVNVLMLPAAPLWFDALDLIAAYIPMGYLAGRAAIKKSKSTV